MKKNYKFVSAAAAALLAVAPVATSAVTSFAETTATTNHGYNNRVEQTTNIDATSTTNAVSPFVSAVGAKDANLDLSKTQTTGYNGNGTIDTTVSASDLVVTSPKAGNKTYTYSVSGTSAKANLYDSLDAAVNAAKGESATPTKDPSLTAGKTYYEVFSATVKAPEVYYTSSDVGNLKANATKGSDGKYAADQYVQQSDVGKRVEYNFTVAPNSDKKFDAGITTADDSGFISNVPVILAVNAYDSTKSGQPYFSIAKGDNTGLKLNDGDTLPTPSGAEGITVDADYDKNGNFSTTVKKILDTAKAQVTLHANAEDSIGNTKDSTITTTESDVASQLQKAGYTVKNGVVTVPNGAKAFSITLTGRNNVNHRTVTVKIPFSTNANLKNASAPAIWDTQNDDAKTKKVVAVGDVNTVNNTYVVKQSANATFNAREFTDISGVKHSFTGTVLAGSTYLKNLLDANAKANNTTDNSKIVDVTANNNGLSLVLDRTKSDVVDLSKAGTYNLYLTATADQFTPVTTYHYVIKVQAKETTTVHVNNTSKTNQNQYAPLYHIYNSGDVAAITSSDNTVRETSVADGSEVYVLGNTKTIDGKEYSQVVPEADASAKGLKSLADVKKAATSGDLSNIWIESKYLKQPVTEAASTGTKTLMHAAYVYDQNGQKTSTKLSGYSTVDTYGTKKINGKTYYAINSAQTKFVVKGNIDGTSRKLTKNAYVYNNKGKRIKSQGKLKKGTTQTTYGASFSIKGKTYYRIGKGHYVKVANFR